MNDTSSQRPIPVQPSQPDQSHQSFAAVTELLDVAPGTLRRWIQRFGDYLADPSTESERSFTSSDVETLSIVRGLLAEGNTYEQITHRLRVLHPAAGPAQEEAALAPAHHHAAGGAAPVHLPQRLNEAVGTVVDTQKAILNSQVALRELMGVVVQDNFNLKEENRKLRERMLDLERNLAEYQRREESRKERMESRMRALEGTLGALQQQVAHWVQLQRERRRGWFG